MGVCLSFKAIYVSYVSDLFGDHMGLKNPKCGKMSLKITLFCCFIVTDTVNGLILLHGVQYSNLGPLRRWIKNIMIKRYLEKYNHFQKLKKSFLLFDINQILYLRNQFFETNRLGRWTRPRLWWVYWIHLHPTPGNRAQGIRPHGYIRLPFWLSWVVCDHFKRICKEFELHYSKNHF